MQQRKCISDRYLPKNWMEAFFTANDCVSILIPNIWGQKSVVKLYQRLQESWEIQTLVKEIGFGKSKSLSWIHAHWKHIFWPQGVLKGSIIPYLIASKFLQTLALINYCLLVKKMIKIFITLKKHFVVMSNPEVEHPLFWLLGRTKGIQTFYYDFFAFAVSFLYMEYLPLWTSPMSQKYK